MANAIAYGFVGREHLFSRSIEVVGEAVIRDAIAQSAAMHTQEINALLGEFVFRTTARSEKIRMIEAGTLQPLDQWGNPLPVQVGITYEVGYPIQGGGTAWGNNRVSRALETVEDANENTVAAQMMDADWLKRHILASILDNVAWPFDTDEETAVTVQPLANNDTVRFLKVGGSTSTDNHYLGQANAIDNSNNPFPAIYSDLTEHPGNGGVIVSYIPENLRLAVKALTNFDAVEDPDIIAGASRDVLAGSIPVGIGDEVLGKVDNVWIILMRALPDNYILSCARNAGPVVAMREYPAASLQGFFPEGHSPDGNLLEMRMIRYAGFGVRNRVAAHVTYVGNATYAVPGAYNAPLAA